MPEFPLLGEPLAVELVNTVVGVDGDRKDLLAADADAAAWACAHTAALPAGAMAAPPSAKRLRGLRDAVRELFDAALQSRAPAAPELARVNATSSAAPLRSMLEWRAGEAPVVIRVAGSSNVATATLATIARSAIEVLGGSDGQRLRRCEGPGCGLIFVASNPRRRWCSPDLCGNRVRVARHYERHSAVSRSQEAGQPALERPRVERSRPGRRSD
jgi:predicted RNA-binding Zn ribbon-like protein